MTQTSTPKAPDRSGPFRVCASLGEDLGFNPEILRVALVALLLWDAKSVLIGYALAGVVVLVSRLLFPAGRARVRPVAATRALLRRRMPRITRRAPARTAAVREEAPARDVALAA